MKKIILLLFLLTISIGYSQSLPLDFETSYTWMDFDGGVVTTIANPQNNGDNNSANVGQMVKNPGQVWGGSLLELSSAMDFNTNNTFSMKAYSIKAGTKVLLKVENTSDNGINFEKEVTMTQTNAWETLTFDFSAINAANSYHKIIIIFDLGTNGDGSANMTYYFDDITLYNESGSGSGLALPFDFETEPVTADFEDFDGATATVIANPQSSGINTSGMVAQIVRDGGAMWAGSKVVLGSNLDFSTLGGISMKVYTTAPIGTTVKFKLEGTGSAEKDQLTTVTGAWETLTFDFTGQPADFNTAVFMFDFGNVGDGSANSTFLFDDVEQVAVSGGGGGLTLPIDFETEPVTSDFTDFDGAIASVIANPQSGGINTSGMVAQIVRNGGQSWAGSKLLLGSNLDFSTQGGISMKVFTTAPIGTTVKFKLEGAGATEIDQLTTATGEWETLTFDFTGQPADFNTLVFMFDFGNVGDGSAASTFLFDDVEQIDVTGGLDQIDLPVDFEGSTTNYTMTDFGGNASSLIVDPEDAGNMAMKVIKTAGAETWAGTTIGTNSGFASAIPLTVSDTKMNVRIWSPDVGTPIRLKVEDSNDPTHTCETETNTTTTGWETIEFDFNNEASGTEPLSTGLNNGWIFNKASLFFNFGTTGASAGEKTYYFDDVMFGAKPLSVNRYEIEGLNAYPNPTRNSWNISTKNEVINSIEIFNILGQSVISLKPNSRTVRIDASNLKTGMYFSKISTDSGTSTRKLIKE